PITVPRGTNAQDVAIAADGTVTVKGGKPLGRIELVTVPAPDGLLPLGGNLFQATAASGAASPLGANAGTTLRQGALERSNVGDAMVTMIDAQRSFEMASKAIQMQDQMLEVADQVKR